MVFGRTLSGLALLGLLAMPVQADERDDATTAAKSIMTMLGTGAYQALWDDRTSAYFRGQIKEDAFLETMAAGREGLGELVDSSPLNAAQMTRLPDSDIRGEVFVIDFFNTYKAGRVMERLVLVKEEGDFRLSGLWANPVPPGQ